MGLTELAVEEGWEYATADTQYHVHGIHPYPARMIPQIANRLIRERSSPGDIVLDPFCGSGGVLTEALLLGRNSIGVDINPLARLIAKVKTTLIEPVELTAASHKILSNIRTKVEMGRSGGYKVRVPYFTNISHWFTKEVVQELAVVKQEIDLRYPIGIESNLRDFFQVCFSMTTRKTSNIAFDDNPYFIRAKTEEDLKDHSPNVLLTFEKQVMNGLDRMREFHSVCPRNVNARVLLADSRLLPLEESSVNLVVTSPPYGEESHTMSYSRFAKLSLLWMGMNSNDINRFVRKTLGGNAIQPRPLSKTVDKAIQNVGGKSKQRAKEIFAFLWDYYKCLGEMFRVLTQGGYCCIVIGDRSAAGVVVSNGELTRELGELCGFDYVHTYQREIPKKVLPRRDYKVELINRENIIVLRKPLR
jgi:DNA modification methylase